MIKKKRKTEEEKTKELLEFCESLKWNTQEILKECTLFLEKWDERNEEYYKTLWPPSAKNDKQSREDFRFCLQYWEKKLNET